MHVLHDTCSSTNLSEMNKVWDKDVTIASRDRVWSAGTKLAGRRFSLFARGCFLCPRLATSRTLWLSEVFHAGDRHRTHILLRSALVVVSFKQLAPTCQRGSGSTQFKVSKQTRSFRGEQGHKH